jgi:UDP-N-acetylmuramoyl-L-alanyl-D-glutamate--2,6-diaminopimelate ligase
MARPADDGGAIELALAMAHATDVVVIAGKGHEQVQEIEGAMLPFCDAEVAREAHRRTKGLS